jgi:hypothetical protein
MSIKLRLVGNDDIDKVLKGLPDQINDKVLQSANIAAARPLVQKEKELAPKLTGGLIDSIGVVKASSSSLTQRDLGAVQAGPRRGGKNKGFHGHLNEYGTKVRATKGKGKFHVPANRGVMPAKPFAFPAWEATKDQVLSSINDFLSVRLNSFMRRTIKKAS